MTNQHTFQSTSSLAILHETFSESSATLRLVTFFVTFPQSQKFWFKKNGGSNLYLKANFPDCTRWNSHTKTSPNVDIRWHLPGILMASPWPRLQRYYFPKCRGHAGETTANSPGPPDMGWHDMMHEGMRSSWMLDLDLDDSMLEAKPPAFCKWQWCRQGVCVCVRPNKNQNLCSNMCQGDWWRMNTSPT